MHSAPLAGSRARLVRGRGRGRGGVGARVRARVGARARVRIRGRGRGRGRVREVELALESSLELAEDRVVVHLSRASALGRVRASREALSMQPVQMYAWRSHTSASSHTSHLPPPTSHLPPPTSHYFVTLASIPLRTYYFALTGSCEASF